MSKKKNKFDFLSEEEKAKCLNDIVAFFETEKNETIGLIAAEDLLNFFLDLLGENIYNKAVLDCKKIMKEGLINLEFELETLSNH